MQLDKSQIKRYYDRNLALLAKRFPQLANSIQSIDWTPEAKAPQALVDFIITNSGICSLKVQNPQKEWILLHSQYDPRQEAEQQAQKYDFNLVNFVILTGLGLGYLASAVAKRLPEKAKFFIIESNLFIFKYFLCLDFAQDLITDPRIEFLIGTDVEELVQQLADQISLSELPTSTGKSNLIFVNHLPSWQIERDFFLHFQKSFQTVLMIKAENLATMMQHAGEYRTNTLKNLPYIKQFPPVDNLYGCFKDIPAILIGAGPSLDKNVDLLPAFKDFALLIAVDTACRTLLKKGIEPHFVIAADPSLDNYKHLQGLFFKNSYLIAEPMVLPKLIQDFSKNACGATALVFIASLGQGILKYLGPYLGLKKPLDGWGSISTLGFDLCLQMGCNPIILIGQDFSYPEERPYCRGSLWQENRYSELNRFVTFETLTHQFFSRKSLIKARDINGFEIYTEPRLSSYCHWLEKKALKAKVRCINASEGGILKGGSTTGNCGSTAGNGWELHNLEDIYKELNQKYAFKNSLFEIISKAHQQNFAQDLKGLKEKILNGIRELNIIISDGENILASEKPLSEYADFLKKISNFDQMVCTTFENSLQKAFFNFKRALQELNEEKETNIACGTTVQEKHNKQKKAYQELLSYFMQQAVIIKHQLSEAEQNIK